MVRLEVRCCCQPKKLRGWIEVPDHLARDGRVVQFLVRMPYAGWDARVETIQLSVATIAEGRREWLAVKSEEVPLETLRRIAGFVEAPGE